MISPNKGVGAPRFTLAFRCSPHAATRTLGLLAAESESVTYAATAPEIAAAAAAAKMAVRSICRHASKQGRRATCGHTKNGDENGSNARGSGMASHWSSASVHDILIERTPPS